MRVLPDEITASADPETLRELAEFLVRWPISDQRERGLRLSRENMLCEDSKELIERFFLRVTASHEKATSSLKVDPVRVFVDRLFKDAEIDWSRDNMEWDFKANTPPVIDESLTLDDQPIAVVIDGAEAPLYKVGEETKDTFQRPVEELLGNPVMDKTGEMDRICLKTRDLVELTHHRRPMHHQRV